MVDDLDVKHKTEATDNIFEYNTMNIISNIIDSRINNILEIISSNYPKKFNNKLIENEHKYLKEHILLEYINSKKNIGENEINNETPLKTKNTNIKIKKSNKIIKKRKINIENQCEGRIWSDYIYNKKTMKKINDIDSKYKVLDYKDINIKTFNEKYIIGSRCSKSKKKDGKFCKLHSEHLIHGNYLEIPSKELCYHFMKDGNYL